MKNSMKTEDEMINQQELNVENCHRELVSGSFGFTLAEVLITLGVIGIVAALTIPNLINGYQKKVAVTRLKTSYSLLTQAITAAKAQHGDIINWERDANKILFDYIAPNIKSEKFTNHMDYDYQHVMCNNKQVYKFLDGGGMGSPFNSISPSIKLANGVCIALNRIDDSSALQSNLFIDINGPDSPNINGKDLFVFILRFNEGKIMPEGYNWAANNDITSANLTGNCNKSAKYGGTFCATVIMKAGWEMPKNYPW